ncbi:hypothetical protein Anapl_15841 [Anas platyrhynchos]|uniref:Uncharacterized protein n=1 Tax=Anas platyrhynchos TaxID=8839 RepID=R0JJK0_ANAPL|nr:hypothetical protein Anapl_15841 [Anas platyrhynchos]
MQHGAAGFVAALLGLGAALSCRLPTDAPQPRPLLPLPASTSEPGLTGFAQSMKAAMALYKSCFIWTRISSSTVTDLLFLPAEHFGCSLVHWAATWCPVHRGASCRAAAAVKSSEPPGKGENNAQTSPRTSSEGKLQEQNRERVVALLTKEQKAKEQKSSKIIAEPDCTSCFTPRSLSSQSLKISMAKNSTRAIFEKFLIYCSRKIVIKLRFGGSSILTQLKSGSTDMSKVAACQSVVI